MRIVFLQDDFPPHAKGGAGIVAATLARELTKRGHELTVVTCVQDKSLAGSFQEEGMRVERIYSDYAQRWRSWRSLYNPATVGRIKEILVEVKPDVVHAHNVHYHLSYWSLRLARKSGAKVFLTVHDVMLFHYGKLTENTPKDCESPRNYRVSAWQQMRRYRFWYNPIRNIVIRRLLKNVTRIFTVSEALKEALKQNGIKNVEVIHNGIDAADWEVSSEKVEAFVREHGLENKKVILFGGRISAPKGGEVILEAIREIARKEVKVTLLLLGKHDEYIQRLLRQAEDGGFGDHVVSAGWVSGNSLKAAYHAATIVAVPSQYLDPFPTVVLEAMACGKPVVGGCFGGIPEMVEDGKTGCIIFPKDAHVLAERVIRLLKDESQCLQMGRQARAHVESFLLSDWCTATLRAYNG